MASPIANILYLCVWFSLGTAPGRCQEKRKEQKRWRFTQSIGLDLEKKEERLVLKARGLLSLTVYSILCSRLFRLNDLFELYDLWLAAIIISAFVLDLDYTCSLQRLVFFFFFTHYVTLVVLSSSFSFTPCVSLFVLLLFGLVFSSSLLDNTFLWTTSIFLAWVTSQWTSVKRSNKHITVSFEFFY